VKATFKRRKTIIPETTPVALSEEFGRDNAKNVQWNAFVRKSGIAQKVAGFQEVLSLLREFLLPVMKAATGQHVAPKRWKSGELWIS
jgi:hypothetical protein